MIRGVVFDLDDTLISEHDYVRSGFNVVASYIVNQELVKKDHHEVYKLLLNLFNKDTNRVFNRVLAELKIEETQELVKKLVNVYRTHLPSIDLLPDAKYILKTLSKKDIPLAIITDGYKITQQQKLKSLDFPNDFHSIIVTDELGRDFWKPHMKPYELVQEKLDIPFEHLVYIGDNVTKDFVTAKKLGMKTIQICRPDSVYSGVDMPEEHQADLQIESLIEIENIV